jgi:hypothetical protein
MFERQDAGVEILQRSLSDRFRMTSGCERWIVNGGTQDPPANTAGGAPGGHGGTEKEGTNQE